MTEKELADILGDNPRTTRKLMAELADAGVSTTVQGSFVASSRMIEDFKKAERDKSNGRMGGNPSLKTRGSDDLGVNPEDKAQKPEARSQNSSSSAREARDDPSSWDDDRLLSEVMAAVGIRDRVPTHWMPPAATIHVGRWRRDLNLPCLNIVDAAKQSRARHDEPPNGPKALDGVMRNLSAQLAAGPMQPNQGGQRPARPDDRAQKMDRWKKIAGGTQ
ncbi:hypothetical protein [Oceaniglobus ichthyenteri]|uniref:hypothetical protein n=1 Tax=Oceaniglobus ichthyenteri TaxID=2136177 RepID=UPI000F82FC69|nr:hypothetical protein [Oceaniglobus ichthyenteri]